MVVTTVKPPVQQQSETKPPTVEELYALFVQKQQDEAKAAQTTEGRLKQIAKDNGLDDSVIPVLAGHSNPEEAAKALAKAGYKFDATMGGEVDLPDLVQKTADAVNKRLFGNGQPK